jgi:NAD+ diphosphatase
MPYIFQGNSLIVPVDTPDSLVQDEVNQELLEASFGTALKDSDSFVIPALEGQDNISVITLPGGELPGGWKAIPFRQVLNCITGGTYAESTGVIGRLLRSQHISYWRMNTLFCGKCGGPNREADSGELARQCSLCGKLEFPRIAPAVIIIVINDKGEALLAHNKKFAAGVYSLIAGFSDVGESLEATVVREIKEEVNIDVKDIRYIRSQPWPFPDSLMVGFAAHYAGGELRPDGIEIEDVRWFPRDSPPDLPGSSSVSRYLINLWLEGKL